MLLRAFKDELTLFCRGIDGMRNTVFLQLSFLSMPFCRSLWKLLFPVLCVPVFRARSRAHTLSYEECSDAAPPSPVVVRPRALSEHVGSGGLSGGSVAF